MFRKLTGVSQQEMVFLGSRRVCLGSSSVGVFGTARAPYSTSALVGAGKKRLQSLESV